MADEKEPPKSPPIKLPRPNYSNLGSLTDQGVGALRTQVGASPDPFKATVVQEDVAAMQYEAAKAVRNPIGDPTLQLGKTPTQDYSRGATFWHKRRAKKVTIINCGVKKTEDGVPMHTVVDEDDNEFIARQDLLEKP